MECTTQTGVALAATLLSLPVIVPLWLAPATWPSHHVLAIALLAVFVSWLVRRFLKRWDYGSFRKTTA
jgi:membrane protein implicated in regulation of membrane protease activity